jgi:hypothetical protein
MRYILLNLACMAIAVSVFCQSRLGPDSLTNQKGKNQFAFTVFGDWGRNGEKNQRETANEMGMS